MYFLIRLLHEEAQMVNMQVRLISEKKLTKRQRRATTLNQARIFKLWDSYTNGEIGAKKLFFVAVPPFLAMHHN